MAQQSARVPYREDNSHPQGRSGAKVKQNMGPARGGDRGRANNGGGVNRKTQSPHGQR